MLDHDSTILIDSFSPCNSNGKYVHKAFDDFFRDKIKPATIGIGLHYLHAQFVSLKIIDDKRVEVTCAVLMENKRKFLPEKAVYYLFKNHVRELLKGLKD